MRQVRHNNKNTVIVVLGALVVVSVLALYFFLSPRQLRVDSGGAARAEAQKLIREVGELMVLPEGEDPTVATVSDPEKLRGQEFFAKANVGDKVLVYQKAGKAILYSVSLRKILEVAPIGEDTGTSTAR